MHLSSSSFLFSEDTPELIGCGRVKPSTRDSFQHEHQGMPETSTHTFATGSSSTEPKAPEPSCMAASEDVVYIGTLESAKAKFNVPPSHVETPAPVKKVVLPVVDAFQCLNNPTEDGLRERFNVSVFANPGITRISGVAPQVDVDASKADSTKLRITEPKHTQALTVVDTNTSTEPCVQTQNVAPLLAGVGVQVSAEEPEDKTLKPTESSSCSHTPEWSVGAWLQSLGCARRSTPTRAIAKANVQKQVTSYYCANF